MGTKRLIGAVLLVAGAVLAWRGWEMHQSLAGRLGDMLGTSNEPWLWMGAGAVAALVGLALIARG